MSRLFWKVFLGFWVVTAVVVVVTNVVLSQLIERSGPDRFIAAQQARLETSAVTVQLLLNQGDLAGLRGWLREQNARGRNPIWLVDERGRDVLGRRVPRQLVEAVERGARRVPAAQVTAPDGGSYRLVVPPPRPPFGPRTRPAILPIGLPIAIVISGFVCWLLARYLARPVHHLQTATRRLAAGDLAVRVAPAMGRRRDEMADLATDFDQMAARLQELLDAQKRLLRDVSHELRTPLARLYAALGLARKRGHGVDAELDRIELEAGRLDALIGELLAVMRLQSGADAPTFEAVDVADLVAEILDDEKLEAESRPCGLALNAPDSAVVHGDRALLRRAIENIVRNGIRHTAPDTAVDVEVAADGAAVTVTIRDHGPGVPEGDLGKLFEAFFRVEGARDRASGGHGLGLAIANEAVRRHGGEISAENAADGGLRVVVRLPADGGAADA